MNINFEKVEHYVEQGYISKQKHPEKELWIYKYTHDAMFDWFWPKEVRQCRGLIVDKDYNIIAKPFNKFFNYHELEKLDLTLPEEPYEIYEKLDGSLIIGTQYQGEPLIASSGSFDSHQANTARKFFREKYLDAQFQPDKTYLFEIIYPENRELTPLVIDYGNQEKLVLLAIRDTQTDTDLPLEQIGSIPIVKKYQSTKINELLKHDFKNKEGYVLRFTKSNFRVKIKFNNYVLKHRIVSQMSLKTVWELLKDGKNLRDLLDGAPEHYLEWALESVEKFEIQFSKIKKEVESQFEATINYLDSENPNWKRKDFALYVQEHFPKNTAYLFHKLDDRDYDYLIWKNLKPKIRQNGNTKKSSYKKA